MTAAGPFGPDDDLEVRVFRARLAAAPLRQLLDVDVSNLTVAEIEAWVKRLRDRFRR